MNKFRLLRADEVECRVSQVGEKGLSLLLYKTARTDANLLDETVGPENWECDFKVVDGVLYGGIGIYDENKDRWVWKWDAGTESNTEAEKGRASDAGKRSGFKWGIGRELYTAPFIWVPADKCNLTKNDKGKWNCYDRFEVKEIQYLHDEIASLTIINQKKEVVYTMNGKLPSKAHVKPDKTVEAEKPNKPPIKITEVKMATEEDKAYIATNATEDQLRMIMDAYHLKSFEDLTDEQAQKCKKALDKKKG